jgi:hypothetical protein
MILSVFPVLRSKSSGSEGRSTFHHL